MLRKTLRGVFISFLLGILAGGICFGQIKSATIMGRVTDSSGAVIPGANVTVVNEGTKVPVATQTGGTGDYTVPFLEPAIYDVTVSKEGFTTYTQTGTNVGVGTTVEVDAQLAVGRTATVVEVKAAGTVALQTETSTVGDTVSTQAIDLLPDINHNPFYYATLQPAVAGRWELMDTTSPISFGIGIYSHVFYSAFSFNGGTALSASITLDGVNIQGTSWNDASVNPPSDSVQEVKTYANDYDPSLGRGQGAVAIVTKSGTNTFHGVVFGRLRNDALDANSFANDTQLIKKPAFKVGYYGASGGGPIKKDKAFFFASWQGMAHNTTNSGLLNVPMNNQAKGDFSSPEGCPSLATAEAASGATPTSNTLGTCVSVGGTATPLQLFNPYQATLTNGIYQHPLITGPHGASDLTQVADPGAVHWFSYYPAANRFPTDQYNDNNYYYSELETFRSQVFSSRVDVSAGKNTLYFSGGIEWGSINTPSPWGKETPQFYYPPGNNSQLTANVHSHAPYGSIGDTITLSPTLVVDARFGVQRSHYLNKDPVVSGVNYAAFSMPSSIQGILLAPGLAPDNNGGSPIGQWTALEDITFDDKNAHETNFHLAASATKVKGNWTLKWGGEFLTDFTQTPNPEFAGGSVAPDGCGGCQYTNSLYGGVGQNTTAATQGLSYVGDVMMGAAWWSTLAGDNIQPLMEEQYLGLFSQNTWKVTPRLTLNLGLRWDLQPGVTDRYNQMDTFDEVGTNPIGTAIGFGAQGAYHIGGLNGASRRSWPTEYTNFGPRLGLAYRVTDTLVVRGGYGISYLSSNSGLTFGPVFAVIPYGAGTTNGSLGATPAGAPIAPMENPVVSPVIYPLAPNLDAPQIYSYQSRVYSDRYQNSYVQQYNLFLEKKVGDWLFSAGYSGSKGSRLPIAYNDNGENTSLFNAPSVSGSNVINCYHYGISCAPSDSSVAAEGGYRGTGSDPFSDQVPNPFNPTGTLPFLGSTLRAKTIPRGQYDGPFPLFYGNYEPITVGYSSYNSLQLDAKHQFGHGLTADIFYVWAKSLEMSFFQAENNRASDNETGPIQSMWNQVDPKANRRYGLDDIPSRFVATIAYDLPFGHGHALNPSNKVGSFLAGGWSIGATEMDESGYALDLYDNSPGSLDARPNRAPNEPLILPKIDQHWYNGKTPVTLPDGRIITPANYTFLRFNPDAFVAPVIPSPTTAGKYINDTYWLGSSAINYGSIRCPSINSLNFTLRRSFRVTERLAIDFQANATNLLNHPNFQSYATDLGSSTELSPSNTNNISLGYPTNSANTYGTHSLTDFDNRQIEFQLKVRF